MAQTRERQTELIAAMASVFRVEADEALFLGYELGLIGVHDEELEQAVSKALQTCKFMPSPAELREFAGASLTGISADSRPLLAWEAFRCAVGACGIYRSVEFDDPIINATVRALGGWERACEMEGDQFYVWYRKEFERTYETLCESGVGGEMCKRLTGACEREGAQSGYGSGDDVQQEFLTGLPQHQPRINGTVQNRIALTPSPAQPQPQE